MKRAPTKAAKTMCTCGGTRTNGNCDRCGKKKTRPRIQKRESAARRGYDKAWREFRLVYLSDNPFCLDCEQQGLVRAASEIHHIQKLADFPELKFDLDNLMPLCKRCHAHRSALGE